MLVALFLVLLLELLALLVPACLLELLEEVSALTFSAVGLGAAEAVAHAAKLLGHALTGVVEAGIEALAEVRLRGAAALLQARHLCLGLGGGRAPRSLVVYDVGALRRWRSGGGGDDLLGGGGHEAELGAEDRDVKDERGAEGGGGKGDTHEVDAGAEEAGDEHTDTTDGVHHGLHHVLLCLGHVLATNLSVEY